MTPIRTIARFAGLVALGWAVASLTACYESPDATLYKPGVYKGRADPLVATQRKDAQQERLRQRFDLTQRDR